MSPPLLPLGNALAATPPVEIASASPTTWIGGVLCLILWVGYGWTLRRSGDKLFHRLKGMSRGKKVFLGSGGMILGLLLLVGGMALLASLGGADSSGLKWWAWPFVLLLGGGFVHAQVLGAAALTTLMMEPQESERPQAASGQMEARQTQQETTPAASASEPTEPEP